MFTVENSFTVIVNEKKVGVVLHRDFPDNLASLEAIFFQWDALDAEPIVLSRANIEDHHFTVDPLELVHEDLRSRPQSEWFIFESEDMDLQAIADARQRPHGFVEERQVDPIFQTVRIGKSRDDVVFVEGMREKIPDNRAGFILADAPSDQENTEPHDAPLYVKNQIDFFEDLLKVGLGEEQVTHELGPEEQPVVKVVSVGKWNDFGKKLISGGVRTVIYNEMGFIEANKSLVNALGKFRATHKIGTTYL